MKRHSLLPALALALFAALPSAYAHDNAYLDTQTAPHGGQLRMVGIYHLELVVDRKAPRTGDKPIAVYVTDHAGQEVAVEGASASVRLDFGKSSSTIALTPGDGNRLQGSGRYASTPGLRATVTFTPPGQAAQTAQFTPLAKAQVKPKPAPTDHSHH